jgi:hypothetical protein
MVKNVSLRSKKTNLDHFRGLNGRDILSIRKNFSLADNFFNFKGVEPYYGK